MRTGERVITVRAEFDWDGLWDSFFRDGNTIEELKRAAVTAALCKYEGSHKATAHALGVSQRTIRSWVAKWDLREVHLRGK